MYRYKWRNLRLFPHNEQVYFNRSTDGGNSWLSNDIVVSSQIGGWIYHHSPVIACDLSNSFYRGNVYICFSDLRNGTNDRDIWLTKSTNRGSNWSNIIRVNNDGPGNKQEEPWICVDPLTGYIWIVFYDTRNYSTQTLSDVYIARSTDGGGSFQNVKVSANTVPLQGWYGDYMGIAAYNNEVRPVWTRTINGVNNELWTAIIDTFIIGIKPIGNEIPSKFNLSQNYPNPFNPSTQIEFAIPKTSFTRLIVYDLLGKEIETLVNEELKAGIYRIRFDGIDLSSGIYFYKLETDWFSETKKMVLLK